MAALIEQGDLKFEYRHRVLGNPQAQMAAEAVECAADQGQFWAYKDKLFTNQQGGFPVDKLKGFARQLSLDTAAFDKCLASGTHRNRVTESTKAAERLGVNSTPTFSLNGKFLELKSYNDVKVAVDKELKK